MVIPICFKCQNPLQPISQPEDGLEIVRYQCPLCHYTSAGFLLGYIEPKRPERLAAQPPEKESRRARSFTDVQEQYRLRAKMQSILDVTPKETRRRPRP
jgi:hypothetical protein